MMNNTEKRELVTLKDYLDAGVIEKFSDFCIYDDKCVLKDWVGNPVGNPINLASAIDKFYDCDVSLITSDPLGVPRRVAIYISTDEFRKKNNLSDDDIKSMVLNKSVTNKNIITHDNNFINVKDIMKKLKELGIHFYKIKLYLSFNDSNCIDIYQYLSDKFDYNHNRKELYLNSNVIDYVSSFISDLVVSDNIKFLENNYIIYIDYKQNKEKIDEALDHLSEYITERRK